MQNMVVVGLQWGDEGKGKIIDFLSEKFDIVVRFQGGSNAGHTVAVGNNVYKFRVLPSGAVRGRKAVIGNGVVLDPRVLLEEIHSLESAGIAVDLLISERAHLVTPYQIQIDGLQEVERAGANLGTTKRGVGPTYADKMNRVGIRVCDMLSSSPGQYDLLAKTCTSRIEKLYESMPSQPPEVILRDYQQMIRSLQQYVGDSGTFLEESIASGKSVLFEGAQGTLLDIDHGTYPFVTSSSCVAANAATGTGLSFQRLDSVLGITKSYVTRVGAGPFPTELFDRTGDQIRERGHEFGTVTGRPRRCGWLDLVALRYAVRINGCENLAVTKIDVLAGLNPICVCVAYDINGSETTRVPASMEVAEEAKPVLMELEGWADIATGSYEELPGALREYISTIEKATKAKVAILSTGPERSNTIVVPGNPIRYA
jgi:adenylosuccinate synthase